MRIKWTLAAALAAIALAVVVTLSHAPAKVLLARSVSGAKVLAATNLDAGACQGGETLPRGTSAIRIGLFAVSSPEVFVRVLEDGRRITGGVLGFGWSGEGATVPVTPLARSAAPVEVCFSMRAVTSSIELLGVPTSSREAASSAGRPLPGRISLEYLQPGSGSWWSRAGAIVSHLGLGHAASGVSDALLVIVLTASLAVLSSWLVVKELR
jgi:hypothetical protein